MMKIMHRSVGAIIKKEGKILMLDRVNFPLGWAAPAGHIEEKEKPEEALKREVLEETGFQVKEYKLLFHEFIPWNECKRGVKGHDWYLFEVFDWEGEVKSNFEAKEMKWVERDKIKNLELERIWKHWFLRLGMI